MMTLTPSQFLAPHAEQRYKANLVYVHVGLTNNLNSLFSSRLRLQIAIFPLAVVIICYLVLLMENLNVSALCFLLSELPYI